MGNLADSEEYQRLLKATKRLVTWRKKLLSPVGLNGQFSIAAAEEGLGNHPDLEAMGEVIRPAVNEAHKGEISKRRRAARKKRPKKVTQAATTSSFSSLASKCNGQNYVREYYDN